MKTQHHPEAVQMKPKRIRTWSPLHIREKQFKKMDVNARFQQLIGVPPPNFCSIIYGRANQGKSPFAVQLAQELVRFGRVLYVSSEELISASLQERLELNQINNPNIRFVGMRNVEDIEDKIKRIHPRFIFIDSVQICNMKFDDFTRLKNEVCKNRKGFHLVSQTTSTGKMLLAEKWGHEVDAQIYVEHGIATCISRFKSSGRMVVYEPKNATKDLFNQPINSN